MASRVRKMFRGAFALALAGASTFASAQVQINSVPANPSGVFQAFPAQNPLGPTGAANQTNYPYPGQCLADIANNGTAFPGLASCVGGSFAANQRSAGSWVGAGVAPFKNLNPVTPAGQTKFAFEVLNPLDYSKDTTTFPGADYYEIGLHEAWGTQGIAAAGLFPTPPAGLPVPDGMQWTGLKCDNAAGCSCPADASASFIATYCTGVGNTIPFGNPLYTPIWGIGQINNGGGPVTQVLTSLGLFTPGTPTAWSQNNYIATWPSISIRGERGRPVVVKWVNEFPNTHVLCPHPEAADWPCAIDRTFMGVKVRVDPGLPHTLNPEKVSQYGSPMQPDNSWVTHLHGGEIPPSTDGFATKWFGNAVTAPLYNNLAVNPPFENPTEVLLSRPSGNFDTYTYPMVQDEATIWFHDHTLGKTHHNVIAGPAGFFPVRDSAKHAGTGVHAGSCPAAGVAAGGCTDSAYTWLDPVTEPRNSLGIPLYDYFLALQDRSFNDDGSINFSNGLGQAFATDPLLPVGYSSLTPGPNPQVHPTWVPEYFGDMVVVNGAIWPKMTVPNGWIRMRFAGGSDSRCWSLGFSYTKPNPGAVPAYNQWFWVIANDQGYLQAPVAVNAFTMCPGERVEILVPFEARAVGSSMWLVNNAPAPFPAGVGPATAGSPYADMNVVMQLDVVAGTASRPAVKSCAKNTVNNWNATWGDGLNGGNAAMLAAISLKTACMEYPGSKTDASFVRLHNQAFPAAAVTFPPGAIVRQMYLNERLDGITGAPFGMQLNGVPFEYKVTETPKKNTREYWQMINLTVDTHPMHPHFVKNQIVARQALYVGQFKAALCGSAGCQPGPVPGGEMQIVPDVNAFLAPSNAIAPQKYETGWKDAVQTPPNAVTTIVADWTPRWSATPIAANATAPGTAGCPRGTTGCAAPYVYEDVTSGPYVWHCHINSHEDSEMMRTSLVVP